jgi:hypothetical protein
MERTMPPPIEYDDLSDDVQQMIAKLQVDLEELKFEANFYRAGVLIAFIWVAERVWHYFF